MFTASAHPGDPTPRTGRPTTSTSSKRTFSGAPGGIADDSRPGQLSLSPSPQADRAEPADQRGAAAAAAAGADIDGNGDRGARRGDAATSAFTPPAAAQATAPSTTVVNACTVNATFNSGSLSAALLCNGTIGSAADAAAAKALQNQFAGLFGTGLFGTAAATSTERDTSGHDEVKAPQAADARIRWVVE